MALNAEQQQGRTKLNAKPHGTTARAPASQTMWVHQLGEPAQVARASFCLVTVPVPTLPQLQDQKQLLFMQ